MSFIINFFKLIYTIWIVVTYFIFLSFGIVYFKVMDLFFEEYKAYGYILKYIKWWSGSWATISGIKMDVIDRDKVPNNRAYVFVCNHRSSFDAPLWGYSNNFLVKGLAKKELMKIPLIGYLFRTVCVIVDRKDKASRKQSVENLKSIIKNNVSIFFFAEGTRNKSNQPLKEFYDGAFRVAIELQQPIAPLVMCNSGSLLPPGNYLARPGTMKTVFLNPISTVGLTDEDIPKLKEQVYKVMEKAILANDDRFFKKS